MPFYILVKYAMTTSLIFNFHKGKRACPPEDVGGIESFYEFLDILKNPKHSEHETMKEWGVNQEFDVDGDPAAFDPATVQFPDMEETYGAG